MQDMDEDIKMRLSDMQSALTIASLTGSDYQNPTGDIQAQAFDVSTYGTVVQGITLDSHDNVTRVTPAANQLGYWTPGTPDGRKSYWNIYQNVESTGAGVQDYLMTKVVGGVPDTTDSVVLQFVHSLTGVNNMHLIIFHGGVPEQYLSISTYTLGEWQRYTVEWDIPNSELNIYQNDTGVIYTGTDFGMSGASFGHGFLSADNLTFSYDRPYQGYSETIATATQFPDLTIKDGNKGAYFGGEECIFFRKSKGGELSSLPAPILNDRSEIGFLDVYTHSEPNLDYYLSGIQTDVKNHFGTNYDWNVVGKTPYKKDGALWKQTVLVEEIKYEV